MVKVRAVRMRGFRSHKDTTFELPGRVTIIAGENGAGKTSIVEAIQLALCGRTAATDARGAGAEAMARAGEGMAVEVTLSLEGDLAASVGKDVVTIGRERSITGKWSYTIGGRAVEAARFEEQLEYLLGDKRVVWACLSGGALAEMPEKDRATALEAAIGGTVMLADVDGFYRKATDANGDADASAADDLELVSGHVTLPVAQLDGDDGWAGADVAVAFKAIDALRLRLQREEKAEAPSSPKEERPDLKQIDANIARLTADLAAAEKKRDKYTKLEADAGARVRAADKALAAAREAIEGMEEPGDAMEAPSDEVLEGLRKTLDEATKARIAQAHVVAGLRENLVRVRTIVEQGNKSPVGCPLDEDRCSLALGARKAAKELREATKALAVATGDVEAAEAKLAQLNAEEDEALAELDAAEALAARLSKWTAVARALELATGEATAAKEALEGARGAVRLYDDRDGKENGPSRRRLDALKAERDKALRLDGAWDEYDRAMAEQTAGTADRLAACRRLCAAFGPGGVRQTVLAARSEKLCAAVARSAKRLGVDVALGVGPFHVEHSGREVTAGASVSERWRAWTAIQFGLSDAAKLGVVTVDGLDVLHGEARGAFFDLCSRWKGGQIIATATVDVDDPAELPKIDGAEFLWVGLDKDGASYVQGVE